MTTRDVDAEARTLAHLPEPATLVRGPDPVTAVRTPAGAPSSDAFAKTELATPTPPVAPGTMPIPLVRGASSSVRPEVNVEPAPLDDRGFGARYEERALLGEGGMGVVRLCRDQRIGREVAMKVIRAGHGSRSDARARFEREARVQGQLEHPSIVPVYDLGIGPDGAAFFTMKRVRGVTLEQVIAGLREGREDIVAAYSRRKLLSAFGSVCLAVAFAHSRGVLHRDLKPANVMLGDYGELYLLDWGLAKIAGTAELAPGEKIEAPVEASERTVAGAVMGTPGYMAPEQVRGESDALDARTDVYALGAILFELLTLEPLHARTSVMALHASTLQGADARPSVRAPDKDVPPEVETICVKATAVDPAERFESAREMHDAIERFLDGDRDLERRRVLAEEHAAAAEEHLARIGADGDEGKLARDRAMREVGAALALEPTHPGAIAAMARLLLDAPKEMPAEARAEFEAQRRSMPRTAARGTATAYAGFLSMVPVMLWLGVKNHALFALLAVLAIAAPAVSFWNSRTREPGRYAMATFVAGMAFLLASSLFMGPLILVPTAVATLTTAFVMFAQPTSRLAYILIGAATAVLPFALEALGVFPPSLGFAGGALTISSAVTELPRVPTTLYLLATSLVLVVTPAVLSARLRDTLAATEERVFMHAWHLRQLLPDAARGAAQVPRAPDVVAECTLERRFAR